MRLLLFVIALACACRHDDPAPAAKDNVGIHLGATSGSAPPPGPAKTKPPRPAALTHVTIKALGMYCEEECPMKVRYALADIAAVYELGFDTATESIFVSYDKNLGAPAKVTEPMIVAIRKQGFDPWLARASWPDKVDAQVVER